METGHDPSRGTGLCPAPRINRRTRINHNNRRVPPPTVAPVMFCDDCDERGRPKLSSVIRNLLEAGQLDRLGITLCPR